MKKYMIIFLAAVAIIIPTAAFSQTSSTGNNSQGNDQGPIVVPRNQQQNQKDQQQQQQQSRGNVQTHDVTITSNIDGADIYIDGRFMGETPLTTTVAEGSHTVLVRLPKFQNYRETVNITRSTTINAFLSRNVANVQVEIPSQFLGSGRRGGDNISVSIDGDRITDNSVSLSAGEHTVTFSYGGYTVEDSFTVEAGQDYVLRPTFSVELTPSGQSNQ